MNSSSSGRIPNLSQSHHSAHRHETAQDQRRLQHRALTNPEFPSHRSQIPHISSSSLSNIPPSLMPGNRTTTDPRLFSNKPVQGHSFELPLLPFHSQSAPPLPPPPVPHKYRHRSATSPPAPPLPPKPQPTPSRTLSSGLPNLPPKIPLYPQSISSIATATFSDGNLVEESRISTEDKDLATALALSVSESGNRQKLWKQEEEDLAKALAESVIAQPFGRGFYSTSLDEAETVSEEGSTKSTTTDVHSFISASSSASSTAPTVSYSPSTATNPELRHQRSLASANQSPQTKFLKSFDDIAIARRLAEKSKTLPPLATIDQREHAVVLPYSPNNVSNDVRVSVSSIEVAQPRLGSVAPTFTEESDGLAAHALHVAVSTSGRPPLFGEAAVNTNELVSKPVSAENIHLSPPTGFVKLTPSRLPSKVSPIFPVTETKSPLSNSDGQLTQAGSSGTNPNQFVESELLRGVSIGSMPPSISASSAVMSGPVPNVLTLPFGRCAPLHIKATTWRHLLKLMARLSGIRIEPTIEAAAEAKGDLYLRTVIQFAKVHHSSTEWRTIIWLTIEHPVPPSVSDAWKYTNGDVNTLPWSYTLSNPPALLCDGSDSPVSKVYTVPSTPLTPHPTLPITFPNMAMYLQSILEQSRKAMNDSSSGLRKLAKMVDTHYPCEPETSAVGGQEFLERSTMGGLFKKVIKMSKTHSSKGRGGNDDTYELVTPFVQDD